VLQQIPRAVTSAPPLFITLPPDNALVAVTSVVFAVVTSGKVFFLQDYKIAVRQIERKAMIMIFRSGFMTVIFGLNYLI
jgi:hypothetical protein